MLCGVCRPLVGRQDFTLGIRQHCGWSIDISNQFWKLAGADMLERCGISFDDGLVLLLERKSRRLNRYCRLTIDGLLSVDNSSTPWGHWPCLQTMLHFGLNLDFPPHQALEEVEAILVTLQGPYLTSWLIIVVELLCPQHAPVPRNSHDSRPDPAFSL